MGPGCIYSISRLVRIHILSSIIFDTFILIAILSNCILMALEDPEKGADPVLEYLFTIIFIVKDFYLFFLFCFCRSPVGTCIL